MSEKPIRLTSEEVRAVLDGRKTQTRRVVKFDFLHGFNPNWSGYRPVLEYGKFFLEGSNHRTATTEVKQPYQPGDILWVRETWFRHECDSDCAGVEDENECPFNRVGNYCYGYKTQYTTGGHENIKWRPSTSMPRAAARLFLKVTNVRVERLQNINHSEIIAEGVYCDPPQPEHLYPVGFRLHFIKLWDTLNAKRGYGWNSNPWVFVIEFERLDEIPQK